MGGKWSDLSNQPGVNIDTMLLLTDGRVLCHEFQSNKWHTLTPSDTGDYSNGSWNSVESLPDNTNIPTSFGGPTNAPTFSRWPCWPMGACLWRAASTTRRSPKATTL